MRRITFAVLDPVARRRPIRDVLEAGCGTGHFSLQLAQRYGWRMHSLDLGWEGLVFGKQLGALRMVQADICRLPYRDAAFDAVVSMDVIVHLPPGREVEPLAEFTRVLAGGLLALRVSALDLLRSNHSVWAQERQRFTRARLEQAVSEQGLKVIRATYANSLLLPVALAKFRIWEPLPSLRRAAAWSLLPLGSTACSTSRSPSPLGLGRVVGSRLANPFFCLPRGPIEWLSRSA